MFTETFTIDRHIEELRAELRGTADMEEANWIRTELEVALLTRDDRIPEADAVL